MMNTIKKQTLDDLNFEDEINERWVIPKLAFVYLIWVFQPLILWSLRLCEFQNSYSLSFLSLFIRYFFFLAGLHVVLIGPIIYFAYPELKKIKIKVFRELALFAFLAPPILSMGYFFGNMNNPGAVYDLVFSTGMLILVSVLVFEATQSLTVLSTGLSTSLFLQWFGCGDILGPFRTMLQMIPTQDLFYQVKTALILIAFILTVWKSLRLKLRFNSVN
jgi:hypothetical protein